MSLVQMTSARLTGWTGPFFPDGVADLTRGYASCNGINLGLLASICVAANAGFHGYRRPQTSDGYEWFWAAAFRRTHGDTLVLFPWVQDWTRSHGTLADRCAALHAPSSHDPRDLQLLTLLLRCAFNTHIARTGVGVGRSHLFLVH